MNANQDFVLFTDTAADLTPEMIAHYGLHIVELNVFMKDTPAQNCTLRGADFYRALQSGKVACTSAANLSSFRAAFGEVLAAGKDILYLAFSSALSCMYQTGIIAAEEMQAEYPDRRIIVIDTLCASMGEGLLVCRTAEQMQTGLSLDETAAYAMENRLKTIHWFTVDDLMFLKRGGRVGAVSAFAGSLLGIKPVMNVSDEGKLIPKTKVRGRRSALLALAAHYGEECTDKSATVFIAHADSLRDAEFLRDTLRNQYGAERLVIGEIGPVIGAHSGPGTIALFYPGTERA
ncbi:MAG: DegV family protein [Oscillospiraceae bacterium]|nr:DegV family protein [Oscillospiraceae bacterium]MCR5306648.1 DegV family protein [Oscillospiraceae bacterium]